MEAQENKSDSPYTLDPEIAKVYDALGGAPKLAAGRGDWRALRKIGNAAMQASAAQAVVYPTVKTKNFTAVTENGAEIGLLWFHKDGRQPGSAVVYAHGGAMIMGEVDHFYELIAQHVDGTGVPFLAVDYRKAPDEATGTTPASDIFTGLLWLKDHSVSLEVQPERIALMGHSAGGGLAAGAAILAKEKSIQVAKQILVYPMLDDRNTDPGHDQPIQSFTTFTHDNNYTGWHALLGDLIGTTAVSPVAAPARLEDFSGLSPAYIEIGELDIFRTETIAYVLGLSKAGVPVEFHLHPGMPHGFDSFPSKLTARSLADRFRAIRSI